MTQLPEHTTQAAENAAATPKIFDQRVALVPGPLADRISSAWQRHFQQPGSCVRATASFRYLHHLMTAPADYSTANSQRFCLACSKMLEDASAFVSIVRKLALVTALSLDRQ